MDHGGKWFQQAVYEGAPRTLTSWYLIGMLSRVTPVYVLPAPGSPHARHHLASQRSCGAGSRPVAADDSSHAVFPRARPRAQDLPCTVRATRPRISCPLHASSRIVSEYAGPAGCDGLQMTTKSSARSLTRSAPTDLRQSMDPTDRYVCVGSGLALFYYQSG